MDNASLISQSGFGWAYTGIVADILTAAIILLVGFVLGKLVRRVIERVLSEIEINKVVGQVSKVKLPLQEWAAAFVAYFIYFVTVLTALNQLGLAMMVLYLIAAAVLIVLVISFTLGVKDFIPNAIAGIIISKNKLIKPGDEISVLGVRGKVRNITLTQSCVITKEKDTIYLPNGLLTRSQITKHKGSRVS